MRWLEKLDMSPRDWGLAAAAFALTLDQASKFVLLYGFGFKNMPRDIEVLPFFNIVMTWNRGISYGLFPAQSRLGSLVLVFL